MPHFAASCGAVIGGKLETTLGESPAQCAQREIKEEAGIDIPIDRLRHMIYAYPTFHRGIEDALRDLYEDFLDAGLIAQAVDALELLRHLDPGDTTGARDLWERGWTRYGRGDFEGAVTLWADLSEIYPEHGDAQRGRYWQARALEQLGRPGEAREIYGEMLASSDTSDFYNRRAMARLGVPPVSSEIQLAKASSVVWPSDPALERARLLTDLGLDGLAQREMELVEKTADHRDLLALRADNRGAQLLNLVGGEAIESVLRQTGLLLGASCERYGKQ